MTHPTFHEALGFWVKLGFINFGGPTGQIAVMHTELVERRKWISDGRFLHALNYCMLLPGPEAQQLAVYLGWLLHRTPGGLVAGTFFILPSFFLMLLLSWVFVVHGDLPWITALFGGLAAAVVGIVAAAAIRIGSRALKSPFLIAIAVAAFVAIFLLAVPFPFIVIGAALLGLVAKRLRWMPALDLPTADAEGHVLGDEHSPPDHALPSPARTIRVLTVGVAVWLLPLVVVTQFLGNETITQEAAFFSRLALLTFGGAYAVLGYVNQAAVQQFGWLSAGEMATGLGLAETTPGPLIMVTQFVGFVAAYRFHGSLDPLVAGTLGSLVTVWATFVPSFVFIFLGAPYVELLRGNRNLNAALSVITAAVVGVILSLAVTFAQTTLFDTVTTRHFLGNDLPVPDVTSIDLLAVTIAVFAFLGIWRFKWHIVPVVLGCGLAGLIVSLFD
ncbi:MAG: chromate efflux transporter [Actinomycetota bacterium]